MQNYLLFAVVYGVCVTGPDTSIRSKTILEFGKGNPPGKAEDNLCAGHLVIEAWFRGLLRESWTKGTSGVR